MRHPPHIEIDGRRFVWRELVERRRAQIQAHSRPPQAVLFDLRDDTRPASQRSAAGRYSEPSLLDAIVREG